MLGLRKETVGVSSTDKGNSDDGSFSFGFSRQLGKRSSMEDFDAVNITRVDNKVVGLFGVFDGHGGSRAAKYVKEHLFENLINHPKFLQDTRVAIVESFETTDKEYLKSENGYNRDAGSTASIAVLVEKRLLVANVGDSRAVICKAGQATTLSTDHKPNKSEERERIEQAGGYVMWAGTWRVGGVLAVSRAFGDKLLKKYVIPIPDIQEVSIDPEVEFLIVASDGLWDVVTEQEAIKMVQSLVDAEAAAKHLAEEALRRGSSDNITCLVLRFHHS